MTTSAEPSFLDLASWVLNAPVGEARSIGIRSDGTEGVTVKQFLNCTVLSVTELSKPAFERFCGLQPRRSQNDQNEEASVQAEE